MFRNLIIAAVAVLVGLGNAAAVFGVVSSREIEKVRNKAVLGGEDAAVVDDFLGQAVTELVKTSDYASISRVREAILANNKSTQQSAQDQYRQLFTKSARAAIQKGFEESAALENTEKQFVTRLNLAILVAEIGDVELIDLSMEKLNDPSSAVRYWAVKGLTGPGIVAQLNAGQAEDAAKKISKALGDVCKSSDTATVVLIADFGAKLKAAAGEELLVALAAARMEKYRSWQVEDELAEISVLTALNSKFAAAVKKEEIGRAFCQLYSDVFQRYIGGAGTLDDDHKARLASVLVEIEDKCVTGLTGIKQEKIKRLIEGGDLKGLRDEHDRLLGSEQAAGQIPIKFGIDYGKKDGGAATAPEVLPAGK